MRRDGQRNWGLIRYAHLIGCLVLLLAMASWAWRVHPMRNAWRVIRAQQKAALNHVSTRSMGLRIGEGLSDAWRQTWPYWSQDAALLLGWWFAFAIGTGVYAKQLEQWLKVHSSGEVAGLRGIGLEAQTLEKNEARKRVPE
jgi:hypothetical protein